MKDGWYERKGEEFSEDQTMAAEPAGMMVDHQEESSSHVLL